MSGITLSPSQTIGPFFHDGMLRTDARRTLLVAPESTGERIRIAGHVYDGDGAGVPDALIEIWQANSYGRYNHPADRRDLPLEADFTGSGRSGTEADGSYWFETVKPGRVPFGGERMQAPHICVAVFARGLLNPLFTRIYFAGAPDNADDPVLKRVPAARRDTLLAQQGDDGSYSFDIVLQGQG